MRPLDSLYGSVIFVSIFFFVGVLFDGFAKWMCYEKLRDLCGAWISVNVGVCILIHCVASLMEYKFNPGSDYKPQPAAASHASSSKLQSPPPSKIQLQQPPKQNTPEPTPQPSSFPAQPLAAASSPGCSPPPPDSKRCSPSTPAGLLPCDFCGVVHDKKTRFVYRHIIK